MAGNETVLLLVVFPPPQLNVAPVVVDDTVKVSDVLTQVRTDGADTLTFGVVTFCVTETDAELVQPLVGSVTVTL